MSLKLSSTDVALNTVLEDIGKDDVTSPVEMQSLRDSADEHVLEATGLSIFIPTTPLGASVVRVLFQADEFVENMQRVAIESRNVNLPPERREAMKAAIEHQIAYIVAGYQSSVQRL
ncbi:MULTISPECIES: hypothetical protein [unclassified Luteibacter]|jgi:hypothetical protein|uniref:hypothetical protein n=1 Tax=unclassified Luteibacter TaxID=2620188 RepID=UPI0005641017|nr:MULTISPECIES: hypothetical protein [unclassified Luteibacter]